MNQKDFFNVDWTKIPEPKLDVNLNHLNNFKISDIELNSTDNKIVNISKLKEISVIYIYPMTGVPGKALPEGWDEIPGARGPIETGMQKRWKKNPQAKKNLEKFIPLQRVG